MSTQVTYRIQKLVGRDDFIGYCPLMKPVSVYGKTKDEVQKKMEQAIPLYLKKHPELRQELQTSTIDLS